MSARWAWLVVVLVTIGAAGVVASEERDKRALSADLARALMAHDQMKAELDDLSRRLDQLDIAARDLEQAKANAASAAPRDGAGKQGAAPSKESGDAPKNLFSAVLASGFLDQMQDQMVERQLAQLDKAVELTPREREDIQKLLQDQAKQGRDFAKQAMEGKQPDPRDTGRVYTDTESEMERILGHARYQAYQDAKKHDLDEQKETSFRSQFTFFSSDVAVRDDQRAQVESIMRNGGFGLMGSGVPDTGETPEWAADLAKQGQISAKDMMAKMAVERRKQLDGVATQLQGVLDADQLPKFEAWRKQQESQLDMMAAFAPDFPVPTPPGH